MAAFVIVSLVGGVHAAASAPKPQLIVSVRSPQVQTYDIETVTVFSAFNNTNRTPSLGPISMTVYNTNGQKLGVGCERCNLTNGTYILYISIEPSISFGTMSVTVHDFFTNQTATASWSCVYSAQYQANLDAAQRRAWLDNTTAANNAAQAARDQNEIVVILSVLFGGAFAVLLSLHRIARFTHTWSWWDRLKLFFKFGLAENPLNAVMKEDGSVGRYIAREAEMKYADFHAKNERTVLLHLIEVMDRLKGEIDLSAEAAQAMREARAYVGIPSKDLLDGLKVRPDLTEGGS